MKFGSNTNTNYFGRTHNQPKKVRQEAPSNHLVSLDQKLHIEPYIEPHIKPKVKLDSLDEKPLIEHKVDIQTVDKKLNDNSNNELAITLLISGISGFLISKYIV